MPNQDQLSAIQALETVTLEPVQPPFLELAFYVGTGSVREEAFRAVEAVIAAGAVLTGDVDIVENGTPTRLASVDFNSLKHMISQRNLRRVYMQGATGITKRLELIEITKGVVFLRTEGENFCGPNRANRRRLYQLGSKAYICFKTLANAMSPYYGAICGEYTLEEPEDLARNPKSLAFRDFFLNRSKLGSAIAITRRNAGEDAYMEEFEKGTYISMSAEFNPDHLSVDPIDSQYRSVRIAEGLVKHLLKH